MLEILTTYSLTRERLNLTRFHMISLEAFFTGHDPQRFSP